MMLAILQHWGFVLFFLVFIKEFIGIRSKVLNLFETLHPFEFLESHIAELVDPDLEARSDGVMCAHQVQVRLEDRETSTVLLFCEVVAVVPCNESLESLQFILRESDVLQEACLAVRGGCLGAEEGRKCCHCSH
jgi:hypothetical protein